MAFDYETNQAEVRAKFKETADKIAAIRTISDPLRDARDKMVLEHRTQEQAINAEIATAEAELFSLMQEHSSYARQMDGARLMQADTLGAIEPVGQA